MNHLRLLAFGLLLMASILLTRASPSVAAPAARAQPEWGKLPLYFIANQGQMDEYVSFYVQGSDKMLYFASDGVTFALNDARRTTKDEGRRTKGRRLPDDATEDDVTIQHWVVKLDFVGANAVRPTGQAETDAIVSYFKGSRDEWHTGLPTYSQIVYRDLWEGIDLAYSGTVNRLKYEFVVAPGADPARIRLAYRGASVRVNDAGQLEVSTPAGSFHDDAPIAYQEVDGQHVPVTVTYALDDDVTYGFRLGAYDATRPLVIDPAVFVYCGFIGGNDTDQANSIALDSAGNVYVTGGTGSLEGTFPVAVGPDLTYNGGTYDAFVVKVKADGTGFVYVGYIGGDEPDVGHSIVVDTAGNAYIAGETQSTEVTFPVTVGPDLGYNGGYKDAFVVKVNPAGTGLVYAGYIGGDSLDEGWGIAIDTTGNAYVVGRTGSDQTTFPVSVGPDLTFNGDGDAFVAKVKADGTGLVYAGYIGGNGNELGYAIAVDWSGNAYVTGYTSSTEATFPVTVGPDITYNLGEKDAFVSKVRADGTGFVYSGYIGGIGLDEAYGIAIDSAGNAYIVGATSSTQTTFPVIAGPDLTYNGGSRDVYVAKVKADGTGLLYAGYIGGNDWEYGYAIAVDWSGNAYVTGYTFSTEATFPVIEGPDLTHNGGYDAFIAKVNATGTGLVYCGYIGGDNTDIGQGIAVDAAGNAYVAGFTRSTEATFPVTSGPDLTYNSGWSDAFVAKVSQTTPSFKLYLPLILR